MLAIIRNAHFLRNLVLFSEIRDNPNESILSDILIP